MNCYKYVEVLIVKIPKRARPRCGVTSPGNNRTLLQIGSHLGRQLPFKIRNCNLKKKDNKPNGHLTEHKAPAPGMPLSIFSELVCVVSK